MAGIRSKVEMLYDARDDKSGMIEIEIQGWQYNALSKLYNTRVVDFIVTTQIVPIPGPPGEPPTQQEQKVRTIISQQDAQYQKDRVDELFTEHGDPIDPSESLTDSMDEFLSAAFLAVTQLEPPYRHVDGTPSVGSDWEVIPRTTTTTTTVAPSTTTTTTTNGTTTTTTTM
jgi:hypothetical protein